MSDSTEDQIHLPTPARREQARRDGDIPKSSELAAALQLLGAITVAYLLLGQLSQAIAAWTTENWSVAGKQISTSTGQITTQLQHLTGVLIAALAPMMILLMFVGIASHWIQTGPMFVSKKAVPDLTRIGPGSWKRRLFSIEGLAFMIVGVPKTLIALLVLCFASWNHRIEFFQLSNYPANELVEKLFALVLTIVFQVAFALLITSLADYWLKYLSHQKRLKMTDQQLRDELRSQNGDPQVRSRQREFRRV